MDDLFRKLNVLVRASLNDMLHLPKPRTVEPRLGRDVDREIEMLRLRINEAVAYEEQLKTRLRQVSEEVRRWDAQADEAVKRDDDAGARYAIEQMKRAEQRRTIAENDLKTHQLVTQELIARVNMLEAAVADARRNQAARQEAAAEVPPPLRRLDDVLRDARERVAAMGDLLAAKDEVNQAAPEGQVPDRQDIEDDLAQRRQRLSKR